MHIFDHLLVLNWKNNKHKLCQNLKTNDENLQHVTNCENFLCEGKKLRIQLHTMANRWLLFSDWIFVISVILNGVFSLDCDNGYCDVWSSFACRSGSTCTLNCYDSTGCAGKPVTAWSFDPSYRIDINCYGTKSCAGMTITATGRNTYINCYGYDSCDDLTVDFTGEDPNNLVEIIVNLRGPYTDTVSINCNDVGSEKTISLCEVNCIAPPTNGFYTCIDVDLECYTKGTCHYNCEDTACCGCTLVGTCNGCNVLHENNLRCHHGSQGTGINDNCIQVSSFVSPIYDYICPYITDLTSSMPHVCT